MVNQASLYGDELLVAALAQAVPASTFRMPRESTIVQALYKLSQSAKFKGLFKNYPFDVDGIEPSSAEISEAMNALKQSRLLGCQNPDLVIYTISPAIKNRYDRFIKSKIKGREELVEEFGTALQKVLKIKPPAGPAQDEPSSKH